MHMKKLISLILILTLLFCCTSCRIGGKTMDGDKNVLERTFKIEGGGVWALVVENITFSAGAVDSYIRTGSMYGSAVKIATDDNIFTSLDVIIDEENKTITVSGDQQYTYNPSEFAITLGTDFNKLRIDGDFELDILKETGGELDITVNGAAEGDITTERLSTMKLTVNGAADLELTGTCEQLLLEGNGAMELDADDCKAVNANVKLSGAAIADIYVSGELYIETNGTCAVTVEGNPTVKQQAINGLSTIEFEK